MIRREASTAAGPQWVLISQVDHARLAGELAAQWGAGGVAGLVAREPLLWAIDHHDDGWRRSEESPDVEPESGRPRSFTEMELPDSLRIWSDSIAAATAHGPLEAYVVAGHFCALLERFDFGWRNDPARAAEARRFLDDFARLQRESLHAWQSLLADNTAARADLALAQLQLFDTLSLWFCCARAEEPEEFQTPQGPVVTVAPRGSAADSEAIGVTMAPWPLRVSALNLEVPARAVPARRYENAADLAAAPAESVRLRWTVTA